MSMTKRLAGFTLIELVIAIVVIAIALTGILSVMNRTTASSADPMIKSQAVAVAESYLEEILLQNFNDPNGTEVGETRATFDDVDDYNALANNGCLTTSAQCPTLGDCPCDQTGNPNNSLPGYTITVTVVPDGANLNGINNAHALRADVRVQATAGVDISVSGYRACYGTEPRNACP
jgi:MSHA pilin protein MshD